MSRTLAAAPPLSDGPRAAGLSIFSDFGHGPQSNGAFAVCHRHSSQPGQHRTGFRPLQRSGRRRCSRKTVHFAAAAVVELVSSLAVHNNSHVYIYIYIYRQQWRRPSRVWKDRKWSPAFTIVITLSN